MNNVNRTTKDLYLPSWLLYLGIGLEAVAAVLLVAALVTSVYWCLIGTLATGVLGFFAIICWKNQSVVIIDEDTFEYTTMFGNTSELSFSDITAIRQNNDSTTVFVDGKKVHIESCAIMSSRMLKKLNEAVVRLYGRSTDV